MIILRQGTASQEVMLGPFLDVSGAPVTGLTIANTDIRIQKSGGATFVNKNSGGAVHVEDGYYLATCDATDTDTPGQGIIQVTMAGALSVRHACEVLPADRYDARYGTGPVAVDVTHWSGQAVATPAVTGVPDVNTTHAAGTAWGSGAITLSSVAQAVIAAIREGLVGREGTAQAGAATTITLDAGASATDDFYINQLVVITEGTGAGQARFVTDYVGATKVATVATWATTPDATSVFALLPFGAIAGASAPTASQVADEVQTRTIAAVTQVNGLGANVVNAAALAPDAGTEIAAAVRTNLTTELGRLDVAVTTRASQTSVDDLPTNIELTAALAAADDPVLAAIGGLHNFDPAIDTVEANITQINGIPLIGDGSTTPFGV